MNYLAKLNTPIASLPSRPVAGKWVEIQESDLRRLGPDPRIDRVFPNHTLQVEEVRPNDLDPAQWSLPRIGAPAAWTLGTDQGGPIVAERGKWYRALSDQGTEERYYPLNHIRAGQAKFDVIDSMLSEYAVLGFEYGYSLSEPNAMTIWEAQFGDFANGAQIMIDQFINSGESKWLRMSGLVMLLPHGYEGQGPEHSSARLERFLQLSAEENWIVANCSTPANYFHILRRQMHRSYRKPLILMTPKSLLRHPMCISDTADFTDGSAFHRVLWDDAQKGHSGTKLKVDKKIRRVVLCSGKVYYDLLAERDARGIDDVYLLRLEQIYPGPGKALTEELSRFPGADVVWCQEEPKNQGAWAFVQPYVEWLLENVGAKNKRARYVGRAASASTATGLMSMHLKQLQQFMEEALG